MQEQEVRSAKRFVYTVFGIVCGLALTVIGCLVWLFHRPIAPELEVQQLSEAVANADLAWINDTCYEFPHSAGIGDLCDFSIWKLAENVTESHHVLSLKLADEYELAFYEGGLVKAYYGYSSSEYLDTAWYLIPETTVKEITEFIVANGVIRQPLLGAGMWFDTVE